MVEAYTCRYSSGQLIPLFQSVAVAELRIKGPLEYLQVQATTLVSLLFIYMIPIASKITKFSLLLYIQEQALQSSISISKMMFLYRNTKFFLYTLKQFCVPHVKCSNNLIILASMLICQNHHISVWLKKLFTYLRNLHQLTHTSICPTLLSTNILNLTYHLN